MSEEKDKLLQRFLDGGITVKEREYLDALQNIDVDNNWTRFQNSTNTDVPGIPTFLKRNRIYFNRIAAAILLILIPVAALYFIELRPDYTIQQVVSLNRNTEILLSDGSMVFLNKGSVISYPGQLNHRRREVKLTGEAWFKVTKAKQSPFYVHLQFATVEVLGTSFNVKEEAGAVTVSVVSGKVSFSENKNKQNAVVIEAGHKGTFDTNTKTFELDTFASQNFLFWKDGRLSFNNEPLGQVFEVLGKCFNTNIEVLDNDILRNRLTTTCDGEELYEILDELSILFELHYYSQGDTFYVERKPL